MTERTNEAAALKEIWLLDSTGREWVSDASDEITDDAEGSLRENLQEIGDLKHLNLTIDGNQIHFNPAHVVAFTIRAHPNPEPPTGDGEREFVQCPHEMGRATCVGSCNCTCDPCAPSRAANQESGA